MGRTRHPLGGVASGTDHGAHILLEAALLPLCLVIVHLHHSGHRQARCARLQEWGCTARRLGGSPAAQGDILGGSSTAYGASQRDRGLEHEWRMSSLMPLFSTVRSTHCSTGGVEIVIWSTCSVCVCAREQDTVDGGAS